MYVKEKKTKNEVKLQRAEGKVEGRGEGGGRQECGQRVGMTAVEVPTSGAQLIRPTKAAAPPSSVILGAFANRNTHYKSGPGSNGRHGDNAEEIMGRTRHGERVLMSI